MQCFSFYIFLNSWSYFFNFYAIADVDLAVDNGLSLAMAYRSRAAILINLGNGQAAMSDLKLAANYGLELKENVDYYIKLAKAYACKYAKNSPFTRAALL